MGAALSHRKNPAPPAAAGSPRPRRLCLALLAVWALQVLWLGWELRGEAWEVGYRLVSGRGGEAVRLEDPFYRWLLKLQKLMPPEAAYLFLDNYEAGVEIEARYHLFPRRHHLLLPSSPPSLLFHVIRHENITFVVERQGRSRPGPGLRAAKDLNAAMFLNIPGPGLAYRIDPGRIKGGFYD